MRVINLIILILLAILFSSCIKDKYTSFKLTKEDKLMIPYELGQTVNFIDSLGQSFALTVIEDTIKWWSERESYALYDEYLTWNERTVRLQSEHNDFEISLSVFANGIHHHGGHESNYIYIKTTDSSVSFALAYDKKWRFLTYNPDWWHSQYFHNSLIINNQIYYDVVEDNGYDRVKSIYDTSTQVFYNKAYGILQIRDGVNILTINQ